MDEGGVEVAYNEDAGYDPDKENRYCYCCSQFTTYTVYDDVCCGCINSKSVEEVSEARREAVHDRVTPYIEKTPDIIDKIIEWFTNDGVLRDRAKKEAEIQRVMKVYGRTHRVAKAGLYVRPKDHQPYYSC